MGVVGHARGMVARSGPSRRRGRPNRTGLHATPRRVPPARLRRRTAADPTAATPADAAARRARWPGSASSTARRSWPGRTARCSWPTSAPTSSRSSRPKATRRAAGARRGSAAGRPTGPGPPPTTSRSTGTSARIRLDLATAGRRRGPPPAPRRADVLVENFRAGGFDRLGFDDAALAALNPGLVHLAISGYGPTGPGRRPARLRLRHPGGSRADVDHRRARRGRRRPDEGRRRDQRRRHRAVRRGGDPRRAGRPRARRRDRRPARPADRRVAPRLDAGRPGQPGPERVRDGDVARPARQRPPEHRPVRDVRDGRRRDRRRRGQRAPVAAVLRGRSACRRWPTTRASPRTATGSANRDELRPILAARFAERTTADWLAALDAADVPAGPINDIAAAFASP